MTYWHNIPKHLTLYSFNITIFTSGKVRNKKAGHRRVDVTTEKRFRVTVSYMEHWNLIYIMSTLLLMEIQFSTTFYYTSGQNKMPKSFLTITVTSDLFSNFMN
jgi:hypothetical protein